MPRPDLRHGEGSQEQFYSHIPHLVENALSARPDRARRAQKELMSGLANEQDVAPAFSAIAYAQGTILASKDPRVIRNGARMIGEVVSVINTPRKDNPARHLEITPRSRAVIEKLLEQDEILQKNAYFLRVQTSNYKTLIGKILPDIQTQIADGTALITFVLRIKSGDEFSQATDNEQTRRSLQEWNMWWRETARLANSDEVFDEAEARDLLVENLKKEPIKKGVEGAERIYYRKYGEISLAEIERMEYPLSKEDYLKVTGYITSALIDSDRRVLPILGRLFFIPTHFHKLFEPAVVSNRQLLANLNSWQELFVTGLIIDIEDQRLDGVMAEAVKAMPDYAVASLIAIGVPTYAIRPYITDPYYRVGNPIAYVDHPLNALAFEEHIEKMRESGEDLPFFQRDDIAQQYLNEVLIPEMKKRVQDLGIAERCAPYIAELEDSMSRERYDRIRIKEIKDTFEHLCGTDFLEKLARHSGDIDLITQAAWQSILKKGMHFLPMTQGINVIEFEKGGVPEIIGLKNIAIQRIGAPRDWSIDIRFALQAGGINIIGTLDRNGNLACDIPIAQEIPALHTMVRHIAVLTFHDLVVQEIKEEGGERETRQRNGVSSGRKENNKRSKNRSLPRVQTDTALVSDVYKKTGFAPRRVELHKAALRGAKDYLEAVGEYQMAIADSSQSESAIVFLKEWLDLTRENAYQTSDAKKRSVPAQFRLAWVTDPISGEQRYLETWVIEHTSPKPTEEELQSPVELFERYYSHSSALASLDQMKPWFVGG